jgi:hypothetical protein
LTSLTKFLNEPVDRGLQVTRINLNRFKGHLASVGCQVDFGTRLRTSGYHHCNRGDNEISRGDDNGRPDRSQRIHQCIEPRDICHPKPEYADQACNCKDAELARQELEPDSPDKGLGFLKMVKVANKIVDHDVLLASSDQTTNQDPHHDAAQRVRDRMRRQVLVSLLLKELGNCVDELAKRRT